MIKIEEFPKKPGRFTVAAAPEGVDALVLAALAQERVAGVFRPVLHIARDAERRATLAAALAFFAPDVEIVQLPAWDCLPYDRVSPNAAIVAERMEALARLAAPDQGGRPRILLTTVNAAVHRLPPRSALAKSAFQARIGSRIDGKELNAFLVQNGYSRSGTVREPGEFAIRGGIVDIFPPGADEPLRLDFFGDEVEGIRTFDPLTQISLGKADAIRLLPVSEVPFDAGAIERFRIGYRERFGAVTGGDPLYFAVSEGRKHIGMEHWLPLFHDTMETVFDYVPAARVTFDHLADEAITARFETVQEHYTSRAQAPKDKSLGQTVYKPLPPGLLYLSSEEWKKLLGARSVILLAPFQAPERPDRSVLDAGGRAGRDFGPERGQPDTDLFAAVGDHVTRLRAGGRRVMVAAASNGSRDRLVTLLQVRDTLAFAKADSWAAALKLAKETVALPVIDIDRGFETPLLAVLTEQDILGDRLARKRKKSRRGAEAFIQEVSSLEPGDLVVHADHGIGRYEGLQTLTVSGAPHDCVVLIYAGQDKLFIPVENIEVLSRYGSEATDATLDKLGGQGWQARKARLKKRLKDMADDLIRIAAARASRPAEALSPAEGLYEEFAARFPYELTEDQQNAVGDVIGDLAAGRPMDRLICGDVGFGKTEVALRGAFVAAMAGKQVAVIVPTTLLARQHYETFRARFSGLPVRVAHLSRLVNARDAAETRKELAEGKVDIIVGTHALLGKQVTFRDLGLVVVDEEQHFGVKAKERLKQLRTDVHVLTMTATPIPRTLQMAMSGMRELSLIASPPMDRLAVRTFIMPFDPVSIREAILREHFRGGQTFFVVPRIKDLPEVQEFLTDQVPEVKFATAHGQLAPTELENVMESFYNHDFDVLVSTSIVESGLDLPAANTMVIHRADRFGLSQLYQLRGRVGRSKTRAYAYLTLVPGAVPTTQAQKRLEVMQTLDELGAGFTLASHDLDIRGAGNLLGEEQSGHIREVGFELYQQMLEEAIANAKAEAGQGAGAVESWSPTINVGSSVLIPEAYVGDLNIRLGLYRRLGGMETMADIDAFAAELGDRFGPLPEEVENLLGVMVVKGLCRQANIAKIDAGPRGATLSFRDNFYANPGGLVQFISTQAGTAKLRPDHTLVYRRNWDEADERLKGVRHLVENLAVIAAQAPARVSSASRGPAASSAAMRAKS